jgi:hypothetical protein
MLCVKLFDANITRNSTSLLAPRVRTRGPIQSGGCPSQRECRELAIALGRRGINRRSNRKTSALLDESTGLGVIVLEHLGVPMDNLRPSDLAAKTLPLTRLKQRHVRLAFPDGTAVDATGFTTEIGPNPPMWGLYMYELWQPSWPYRFVAWPDFGVPDDQQDADFEVGCRGGVGRTGTVLSCMASLAGVPPTDAVSRVREHYASRAVDNSIQEARILGFARRHPR